MLLAFSAQLGGKEAGSRLNVRFRLDPMRGVIGSNGGRRVL